MSPDPLHQAANDLKTAAHSILLVPSAVEGDAQDAAEILQAVYSEPSARWTYPLVERFDAGALVRLEQIDPELVLVGLVDRTTVTVMRCNDPSEADSLYAGAATQLGVLSGRCEGCAIPIPCVYQLCSGCA